MSCASALPMCSSSPTRACRTISARPRPSAAPRTCWPSCAGASACPRRRSMSPNRTEAWTRCGSVALGQLPRDQHLLDLARPVVDLEHAHVAVILLDRIVVEEAVAAVDLDC